MLNYLEYLYLKAGGLYKFTVIGEIYCLGAFAKLRKVTISLAIFLTCQRLIFRSYGEPATENVTSPRAEVRSQSQDTGNDPPLQRQYGGINNNMAAT